MKIIALHDLEEVATLLTDITMITEVDVTSVPTLEKFQQYLNRYTFNAAYLLDKYFEEGIKVLLSSKRYPKAVVILLSDEANLDRFLRLGLTEANLEPIPFNPLTLFVKTKALVKTIQNIELGLEQGVKEFDFFRYGLFNVLNTLAGKEANTFLSVKDAEENEVLYSLRIRNGQVVSASEDTLKIARINADDAVPKTISFEPVSYQDKTVYRGTAEFYSQLLKVEEVEEVPAEEVKVEVPRVELVQKVRENPLRERRVYQFTYKGFPVYSQPPEKANLPPNSLIVFTEFTEAGLNRLKSLLIRNPYARVVTTPVIKGRLKQEGFLEKHFFLPDGVQAVDTPFLGAKLEGFVYFPNGILITGNLFGSYVSKEIPFLDRVFLGHLRVFHEANVSSTEKLQRALEKVEPLKERINFVFPTYGYAIDRTLWDTVFETVKNLNLPTEYRTLSMDWKRLAEAYGIPARSYEEFLKILNSKEPSLLFNLLDDIEVLDIVPLEL
ncbi:MAG: hypothetical protein GXO08_05625 [Aquificae bacterium]|nr:hypothetical protein [Aquificota bacterium]